MAVADPADPAPTAVPAAGGELLRLEGMLRVRSDAERRFELRVPTLVAARGDRLALVGRTGCGKSTLVEVLAVAKAPDGVTRFDLHSGTEEGPLDLARAWRQGEESFLTGVRAKYFGYVQQVGGLLDFLPVRDNIGLPLAILGTPDPRRVRDLAEQLEIDHLLGAYPGDLSVGQRQRTAIARALVHRPAIVLADEPTAALDLPTAVKALTLMTESAERQNACVILATHDRGLAAEFRFRFVEASIDVETRFQRTVFEERPGGRR